MDLKPTKQPCSHSSHMYRQALSPPPAKYQQLLQLLRRYVQRWFLQIVLPMSPQSWDKLANCLEVEVAAGLLPSLPNSGSWMSLVQGQPKAEAHCKTEVSVQIHHKATFHWPAFQDADIALEVLPMARSDQRSSSRLVSFGRLASPCRLPSSCHLVS